MSRTRQPSTRRIGAAERAIAVLDTLAEAGELGTNEIARRTGMTPSTVSRQLGTLAASGLVERVAQRPAAIASACGSSISRTRSSPGSTCERSHDRIWWRSSRRPARPRRSPFPVTRTRSRWTSSREAITCSRSRSSAGPRSGMRPRRARSCSPSRGGSFATAAVARVHASNHHGSASARTGGRAGARARVGAGGRRARAGSGGDRRARYARAGESSRRWSRSRARALASTRAAMDAAVPLLVERADAISRELGWRAGLTMHRLGSSELTTASRSDIEHPDGSQPRLHQLGPARRRPAFRARSSRTTSCARTRTDRWSTAKAFLEQTAKPVTISGLEAHDVVVRLLGDVAIVHGRTTYTGPDGAPGAGGTPTSGRAATAAGSRSRPT